MTSSRRSSWLRRFAQAIKGKGARGGKRSTGLPAYRNLSLERLEDRLAPATDITVVAGAAGTGTLDQFLSATNGTITTADDSGDTNATLSVGALQGVESGVAISISATDAIIFNDIGTLSLQTGAGLSASFTTSTGAILFSNTANTVATAGAGLSFSAGTNDTIANLNTAGGDVFLTAGTTGPGGAGGSLQFGNILTSGSGNLTFQATAGLTAGSGTITQSGSGSAASGLAISASADGDISVNSLRGTTVGLTSASGSVTSTGSAAVQASAELTVSAATGITLNTLAVLLQASNSTSGAISITQLAAPPQTLTLTGFGVVNHAAGGSISLDNLGSSITVSSNGVQSNNGTITLAATDLSINSAVNSGTARTILTSSVAGGLIDLGTNTSGTLGLTQAELNEVTASILQIGSFTTGNIDISAAIAAPASWSTLALLSGDTITEEAAGTLNVQKLRVSSINAATLLGANNVGVLAGNTSSSPAPFAFNDGTRSLTIGVVDGNTGFSTSGSAITLQADNLVLSQPVNAGNGIVTLEPFTNALQITLGTSSVAGTTFGLTDTDLSQITAGVLRIGDTSQTGGGSHPGITISSSITRHTGFDTLSLITQGSITQTAALSVANLAVQAAAIPNDIVLTNTSNDVDVLAGTANFLFNYTDANALTVGTVDGVAGVRGSGVQLKTLGTGDLTLNSGITGNGTILNVGGAITQESGSGAAISASFALVVQAAGPVTLTNPNNSVQFLTAGVTGAFSYTNAGSLGISPFSFSFSSPNGSISGSGTGVTTTNAAITIATVAGDLNVQRVPVNAGTADVSLTAGSTQASPDHILSLQTLSSTAATISGGNVRLTADRMALDGGLINVGTGSSNIVTIQTDTVGRSIDLGGTGDPNGTLTISQAELNTITAGIVRIGSSSAGNITISAAITAPTGWSTLSLIAGGGVSETGTGAITVTSLAVQAANAIDLQTNASAVGNLASSSSGGGLSFLDSRSLTVTTVDSVSGIRTAGDVLLESSVANTTLTVSQPITTNGAGDLTFLYDNMTLGAAVTATGHRVILEPFSGGQLIDVGGADALGTLGLDTTDLGNVTADTLQIGNSSSGDITISNAITLTTVTTLDLETGGGITETTSPNVGTISVANLAIRTVNAVILTNANDVTTGALAADVTGSGQGFLFTDANGLTIGTADSLNGITTNSGVVTLSLGAASVLTVSQPIDTTAGGGSAGAAINLNADDMALSAAVDAGTGIVTLDVVTPGQNVNLGSDPATPGSFLGLTNAELGEITASILRIGDAAGRANNFTVSQAITAPVGWNTLSLFSNTGSISQDAGASLSVANLLAIFTGSVSLNDPGNAVGTLAALGVQGVGFVSSGSLTVGSVDPGLEALVSGGGFTGVLSLGNIDITAAGAGSLLTVANPVNSNFLGFGPGNIVLTADDMAINASVTAGTGLVTLQQFSTGRAINLGTNTNLGLTTAELAEVTAGLLRIGQSDSSFTGGIDVTVNTATSASFHNTLSLRAGGGNVTESGGGLSGTGGNLSLAVQGNGVNLNSASNAIVNVAGIATGSFTTSFILIDGVSLNVNSGGTPIDGLSGIQATNATSSGILLASSAANNALSLFQPVSATNGNITLTFDNMALNVGGTGAVNAGTQTVTLQPFTASRAITLGSKPGGTLGLTSTDLNAITAGVLQVGNLGSYTGNISVTAPVSAPATWNTLRLFSTTGSVSQPGGALTVTNLVANAGGGVNLADPANAVSALWGGTNGTASSFTFVNSTGLTVGGPPPGSTLGIRTAGGSVSVTALGAGSLLSVVGAVGIDTTNGGAVPAGAAINLNADDMTLSSPVNGGSGGIVTLDVVTAGQNVNLGSDPATPGSFLGLTNAELGEITASILRIGDANNRAINFTLTAAITAPAGWNTLSLFSNTGSISQDAGASLTVANLLAIFTGSVSLNDPGNAVGTLAALGVQGVGFVSSGSLTVGSVDPGLEALVNGGGFTGVLSLGNIGIAAAGAGSLLTVTDPVNSNFLGFGPGNITLSADDMAIHAQVFAGTATVTLQQGGTATRNIDLGLGTTAGDLGLSDAELAQVTASVLRIGRTDNAGNITITAPVTTHAGYSTLSLLTGGGVSESGAGAISVTNLDVQGAGGVNLSTNASTVSGNLSGSTSGQAFSFTNSTSLTVDTADTQSGISTSGGAVTLTALGSGSLLTINKALTGGNANVNLNADDMAVNATVSAGTATVTLAPVTSSRPIDLGLGTTAGDLGLSDTELAEITAAILRIGSSSAGTITLTGNVTTHAGYSTLTLLTGGGIVEGSGSLSVTDLALNAATGIGSTSSLVTVVGNLIFQNLSGAVQISNTGVVTIKAIDNLLTAFNQGTNTTLATVGALLFAVNTTSAGTLTATANEAASGSDDLTVSTNTTLESTAGDVVLQAGDNLILQTGSIVQSDTGTVALDIGFNDNDSDGSSLSTIAGTILGTSPTVSGGSGPNNLLIDFTGGASLPDGLTFTGGSSGKDTLALSDAGGSAAHSYTLRDTSVVRDGTTISISSLASVTATGGNLADTFNVTPSSTVTFTVNGGLPTPPASPGDQLTVNLAGTTSPNLTDTFGPTGFAGMWTFGNRQAVSFTGIERLIPTADLVVTLSAAPNPVLAGSNLTYTLVVSNTGPSAAQNVTLTDPLPAGTTLVSLNQTTGPTFSAATPASGQGGTVTLSSPSLAAGASASFTLVVKVTPGVADGTVLSNTATASTSTADPLPAQGTATVQTAVHQPPSPPPPPPPVTQADLNRVALDAVFTVGGFVANNAAVFTAAITDFDNLLLGFLTGSASSNQAVINQVAVDAFLIVEGAETGNSIALFLGLENMSSLASSLSSSAGQLVATYEQDLVFAIILAAIA